MNAWYVTLLLFLALFGAFLILYIHYRHKLKCAKQHRTCAENSSPAMKPTPVHSNGDGKEGEKVMK